MLAFGSIQSLVSSLIAANTYVAQAVAVPVITDDGLQDSAIEAALRTVGCVVVVPPIVRAVKRDRGGKVLLMDAEVAVRIAVAPRVNTAVGGANRNVYTLVTEVTKAIVAWDPPNNQQPYRFDVSEEWLQLVTNDPGLIAYELSFSKSASIN